MSDKSSLHSLVRRLTEIGEFYMRDRASADDQYAWDADKAEVRRLLHELGCLSQHNRMIIWVAGEIQGRVGWKAEWPDALQSGVVLGGSGRVCPHCHESLERYEDPKAVEIIGKLESQLRQETMRVNWLLARRYDHKTRESVDAEIFACGDCDHVLVDPDQCAAMSPSPKQATPMI